MAYRQSYFALGEWHPRRLLQRLLNPYRPLATASLHGHPLTILATGRAARALGRQPSPLTVEMQLYFSCVVKKRVLFHQGEYPAEPVTEQLRVRFRTVEALSCDPLEFAANYPEGREFDSPATAKMHPSRLYLDRHRGQWQGSFDI
jgi:hypothetical protein